MAHLRVAVERLDRALRQLETRSEHSGGSR